MRSITWSVAAALSCGIAFGVSAQAVSLRHKVSLDDMAREREVTEPQAMIYQPGLAVKGYVAKAGGFSNIADKGHILVIHPDGSTELNGAVQPGDRILVLVKLPGRLIELIAAVTTILYQSAIAVEAVAHF